jgi:hypothetical protein
LPRHRPPPRRAGAACKKAARPKRGAAHSGPRPVACGAARWLKRSFGVLISRSGPCITYLALKWSRQMRAAIGSWQACAPTVSHDGRRDFRRP